MLRAVKTLIFPAIVCIIFAITTQGRLFYSRSVMTILRQSVFPALIVMAMLPNMTLGMMDFSMGATVMTSAIIAGNLMNMTNTGIPGLIIFALISGVILSSITGFLNNVLRIPIIIVALGLLLIYEALPRIIFASTNGTAIIDVEYAMLAQVPYIFIVFAVAFVLFYIIMNKTTHGHNLLALGGNDELAKRAGLNTNKIKQMSFSISGIFAGFAAAIYMATQGQINVPSAFGSMVTVMDAFLGLFLGMFLSRFCNVAIGIVIAIVTMTVMTNGLVTMGIDATVRDIVKAVVLFLLLAVTGNQPYVAQWRANKKRAAKANEEYAKEHNA